MSQITITAKRNNFMRCGVAHKDTPVTWEDGAFTDAQIRDLKAEPMLVVYDGAQVPKGNLDDALVQLQAKNDALQDQVTSLTSELVTQQNYVTNLTADKTALQANIDGLSGDKTALQATIDTLTGEKDTLQKQLDELNNAGGKTK
ncbi:hypothetical protein ACCY16_02140 [Candidatus Pantoea formicae]|uniref:hypothetical protein n=1 Tax=Candidatus Pantoea formicae TaxID=2608355 RepID=UPI003EDA7E62